MSSAKVVPGKKCHGKNAPGKEFYGKNAPGRTLPLQIVPLHKMLPVNNDTCESCPRQNVARQKIPPQINTPRRKCPRQTCPRQKKAPGKTPMVRIMSLQIMLPVNSDTGELYPRQKIPSAKKPGILFRWHLSRRLWLGREIVCRGHFLL
jgi:hypothetical protein